MLFALSNLPYWILLGTGIVLFLFIIFVGGGDDDLDLDANVDVDIDADLDVDTDTPLDFDTDADAENGFSFLQALGWLGIGKAPLILLLALDLSLWGLIGWIGNTLIQESLGGGVGGLMEGGIFLGSLAIALMIGRWIAQPIGKIFASFGEDTSSDRLIGCVGFVCTGKVPVITEGKIGQVDVIDPARNRITVNAVLPDWATVQPNRGEQVLVIDRQDSLYFVVVKNSLDQESWFNDSSRHSSRHGTHRSASQEPQGDRPKSSTYNHFSLNYYLILSTRKHLTFQRSRTERRKSYLLRFE